ncbi:MAG: segregation/condensation protein A [Euryarchaeota archaeon]|nr:segregation/condensation protein A [Euryarchaeota archaeon]
MYQCKIDSDVVSHLLFHKALIDEQQDASRINQYITLAQQAQIGEHFSIEDPFDRSIALAFDLVINNQLNPWDIDLIGFSTMYLKKAKDEKINLMTAGRIIYMAWKVLRLQSDDLVGHMENSQQELIQPEGFDWADLPTGTWVETEDGYSYTNLLMKMPEPPLAEPLRRTAERKVTLIELLHAFDQVRKESEEYQLLEKMRQEERDRLNDLAIKHMKGTTHEDHLEEDVMNLWNRIQQIPQETLTFSDLCTTEDKEERIKMFISILFLAYENKIEVTQKQFPYGKIYIKNLAYT